jgi:hypothetical protein
MPKWYISWPFGILRSFFGIFSEPLVYFPALVFCAEKNLATLLKMFNNFVAKKRMDVSPDQSAFFLSEKLVPF